MADKVDSLLGFAVKAGKLIYGVDNMLLHGKKRYLVVVCKTLSPRSLKNCLNYASRCKLPIIRSVTRPLEEVLHKTQCKAVALTDRQMSEAILKNIGNDYEVLTSEV